MRPGHSRGLPLAITCGVLLWGCGSGWTPLSPSAPSSVAPEISRNTPGQSIVELRRVDKDGDGYDDGPEDSATPAPETPAPTPPPGPDGVPVPDPAVPVVLTVNIVGTFGTGAFQPNPLQAVVGNTIVWTNNDMLPHIIVLDDGTPVGTLAPGQSSVPISLASETMSYHCELHPSMTGQVTTIVPDATAPPDPTAPPASDPTAPPAPAPNDDGYEDDYYLRLGR